MTDTNHSTEKCSRFLVFNYNRSAAPLQHSVFLTSLGEIDPHNATAVAPITATNPQQNKAAHTVSDLFRQDDASARRSIFGANLDEDAVRDRRKGTADGLLVQGVLRGLRFSRRHHH